MALLCTTIITDICSQLGDPNEDTYGTRAKDHLQAAISQLIADKQYKLSDLPGYVQQKSISLSTTKLDISGENVIEIISIVPKYDITYATSPWFIKVIELNNPQLGGIYANLEQQPTDEDVLVIRHGDYLEAIINETASNFTSPQTVYMFYIEDPDITGWVYSGSITDALDYFRMSFIQRAKLLAIQTLKTEDELTN